MFLKIRNISSKIKRSKVTDYAALKFKVQLDILFQNFFVVCCFFPSKLIFSKILCGSNSLNPDQARHFVGPDLGPNCLQRSTADAGN